MSIHFLSYLELLTDSIFLVLMLIICLKFHGLLSKKYQEFLHFEVQNCFRSCLKSNSKILVDLANLHFG